MHKCLNGTDISVLSLSELIQLIYLILLIFVNTHLRVICNLVAHPLDLNHSRAHFLLHLKCHQLELIKPFGKVSLVQFGEQLPPLRRVVRHLQTGRLDPLVDHGGVVGVHVVHEDQFVHGARVVLFGLTHHGIDQAGVLLPFGPQVVAQV